MTSPGADIWFLRPHFFLAGLVVSLLLGPVSSPAQTPPPSMGQPSGLTPQAPAPAVVDTAVAILEFSPAGMLPTAIHVLSDTVLFGETIQLVLDFSGSNQVDLSWQVAEGELWLLAPPPYNPGFLDRLLGRGVPQAVDTGALPAHEGTRITAGFRVYRNNPFQVQAGEILSPVIQVKNRISGNSETAAIRAPRPVGMSPLVVLGLLAGLILVLLAAWILWARGPGREKFQDREIPPPAWLTAGIELWDLFREGSLGRGESRRYLDGLAGIARRYVAGRYRISAQDMTGREITSACRGLGHSLADPGTFARLIDEFDHRRYDPEASAPGWCREQTIELFELMGRIRVMPRFTEVPADLLLEGEQAWSALGREFAGATGRSRIRDHASGQGGG